LADIYAAREHDPGDISSRDLCSAVNAVGGNAVYFPSFADIIDHLLVSLSEGDMLLTMGAGEAYMIGEALLGKG
jgi:UDP-N-acetylmuramate--alanine ligase